MNPNAQGHQQFWLNYLRKNADQYDAYFLDTDPMRVIDSYEFPSGGGCDPWPSACTSTQEIPDDSAEEQSRVKFVNAMSHLDGTPMRFIFNKAYPPRSTLLDVKALNATNHLLAADCEDCVIEYRLYPNEYGNTLDEMALVNTTPGAYVFMSQGNAPIGSAEQTAERLVTTAMVWLGYSEGHTIIWPDLETGTYNLAIWPEDLIYPSNPLESLVSSNLDLQVAAGVWRREFATCYQNGHLFGRCAALVNSTGGVVAVRSSWLSQTYGHVVSLSGGDVLSGGKALLSSTRFVPNSTTIPSGSAILLAP